MPLRHIKESSLSELVGTSGKQTHKLKREMTSLSVSCEVEFKRAVEKAARQDYFNNYSSWVVCALVPKLRRRGLLKARK